MTVRVASARTMLASTDLSAKSIASRTGFAGLSHFSRMVRAAFGDDLSIYRDQTSASVDEDGNSSSSTNDNAIGLETSTDGLLGAVGDSFSSSDETTS